MPFMYHYANRPGLSTQRSRQTIAEFFNTSTNGLPGNDGQLFVRLVIRTTISLWFIYRLRYVFVLVIELFTLLNTVNQGAMGSYVTFYLAGMYPLPATRQFLLSSPYFKQISFFNPAFNTTTTIRNNGFAGNPSTGTGGRVFVQVSGPVCQIRWAEY